MTGNGENAGIGSPTPFGGRAAPRWPSVATANHRGGQLGQKTDIACRQFQAKRVWSLRHEIRTSGKGWNIVFRRAHCGSANI
jgi:hypothetical protein